MGDLPFQSADQTKLSSLSRDDLEKYTQFALQSVDQWRSAYQKLLSRMGYVEQERLSIADQLVVLKHKHFGRSSEKRPREKFSQNETSSPEEAPKVLLPSLRYPNLDRIEKEIDFEFAPDCQLCGDQMLDMKVTENSEYVTVIQKSYHVVQQKRHQYRCSTCHGSIQTAPAPKRLKPGSAYSDEVAIDAAISKYADHLPIERQATMAKRQGLTDLQPQTLIAQTHYLAEVMKPLYERLKEEIQNGPILYGDETRWPMMEGDEKKNWWFWGFSNEKSAFYEAKNSRATEAARSFIKDSKAEYLMSDAYAGYTRCTEGTSIRNAFCLAHARRKFVEAELNYPQATPMLKLFGTLFSIEREIKNKDPAQIKTVRQEKVKPILREIKEELFSMDILPRSSIGRARSYMLKHWIQLTRFLEDGRIPATNNLSERGLRGIVLGRKNFLGNHSKRGAKTTSILYSIMESCKLNKVDPYQYLRDTLAAILNENPFNTPLEHALKSRG